jgi:hypothetical protein
MSDNDIGNDSPEEIHDNIGQTSAAMKVRHILETAVMPRVAYMLNQTKKGEAIHACEHLVGMPGDGDDSAGPPGFLDWMCEGVGMMCPDCTVRHMSDETTPHCDKRHACCIVCGQQGDDLNALDAKVELREFAVMTSDASDAFSTFVGERVGRGFQGIIALTPIAWECRKHDGFFESKVKLVWPGLSGPADVEVEDDDSAARYAARKARKAEKAAKKEDDAKKAGNAKAKAKRKARRKRR